jgi:rubrerythrin
MDQDALRTALYRAMDAERDGYQFYMLAARNAEDEGARETFARLADDEREHHAALQRQLKTLLEEGTWDRSVVLEDNRPVAPSPEFFSEGFRRRLRGRHFEMSALSIGILLERNAIEFYSHQADIAETAEIRRFFSGLADWENTHYQLLLRHDEALREEYWVQNRFSPLL